MISREDTYLPPAPQTGRAGQATDNDDDEAGLWSQILSVFRDISGSFDPFANDGNPAVRALGRTARLLDSSARERPPGHLRPRDVHRLPRDRRSGVLPGRHAPPRRLPLV